MNKNHIITAVAGTGGGAGQQFDGAMDDVRIYNRALSPAEVYQLYQFGLQSHAK